MSKKFNGDGLHFWAPTKKLGGGWLLWKDSPSPPAAPDPVATANAQSASNADTARLNAKLNRVNQYTPWGSLTYSQNTTPDSFDQQGYDAAMAAYQNSLTEFQAQQGRPAGVQTGNLLTNAEMQNEWSMTQSAAPTPAPTAPTRDQFTTRGNSDSWNSTITLSPEQQALLDSSNRISQSMANLGESQIGAVTNALRNPVDFSGAPSQVNNVQAGPMRTSAGYGNIQNDVDTSNLNPMQTRASYGQIQDRLDTSNVPGMIGGDRLADALSTQRDSLYRQRAAYMDPQWQGRQRELENKLVQQGVMQNSEAWNNAMQDFNRQRAFDYEQAREASITGGGAEQSRLFGLGLASNQNAFNQALASGTFANNAQAQGFGQELSNANLNNSVNQAQFAQNLASMQAHNAAQQQGFGQDFSNAQLGNAAQSQAFNQGLMNANLQNAGRQQNINEIMLQRQNPLNELNALRTGSQVTSPQFGSVPQTNVAATDVMSPINNAFNSQMNGYNSQVAQNNANTNAMAQIAAAFLMSDRRLKRNVRRIGTHDLGIGIYSYDYVWGEPGVGVMADELEEVLPEAVSVHPSGFKMVNYGML